MTVCFSVNDNCIIQSKLIISSIYTLEWKRNMRGISTSAACNTRYGSINKYVSWALCYHKYVSWRLLAAIMYLDIIMCMQGWVPLLEWRDQNGSVEIKLWWLWSSEDNGHRVLTSQWVLGTVQARTSSIALINWLKIIARSWLTRHI